MDGLGGSRGVLQRNLRPDHAHAALVEAAGTASTIPERANRTTYVPITSSVWDQQDKIDYHPVTSSFDAQDKVDYHPVP